MAARNGTGTYVRTYDWTDERDAGNNIDSTKMDVEMDGFAAEITNSVAVDGQSTMTAALKMGSQIITGLATGTLSSDAATVGQVQAGTNTILGSVAGTVDAITASASPAITAYAAGQSFRFVAAGANTTNVTLNVNGLGAKAITKYGTSALEADNITSGMVVDVTYDGTRFQLKSPAVPAGRWEFVEEQVITTNTADLEFSHDGIDLATPVDFVDGYTYRVEMHDMYADTSSSSVDGTLEELGAPRSGSGLYSEAYINNDNAGGVVSVEGLTATDMVFGGNQGNTSTNYTFSLIIDFHNLASTSYESMSFYKMYQSHLVGGQDTMRLQYGGNRVHGANSLRAATHLNLFPSLGNWDLGVVRFLRRRDTA